MEYPSLHVASHIANICKKYAINYNNTKIQKLIYCCYGCVLVLYNKRLCDEYPRAWKYGPVYPRVYRFINKRGNDIETVCPSLSAENDVLELLEEVVVNFGKFSASALSRWTHMEQTPWDFVVNDMDAPNSIIPDDLIAKYFRDNVIVT